MQNRTALLVIDVQLGMFDESDPVYQGEVLLNTLSELQSRARAAGVPVVHIQHSGTGDHPLRPDRLGWPIHPRVAPLEGEPVIHKLHPDAFQGTELQTELDARGIQQLIIGGIQSEYCVDTTCRRAYSLGYDVILVQDAHSTWKNEVLSAPQIIAHHNQTLGGWFATLRRAQEIQFVDGELV